MIFVTVGNTKQRFHRLVDEIHRLVREGFFQGEDVLMQTGYNREEDFPGCRHIAFLDPAEYRRNIESASVVVLHGGAGSLYHVFQAGKKPVVMPRRVIHGEHVDDQLVLVQELESQQRIIPAYAPEDLARAITEARGANARPAAPAPARMIALVAQAVDELLAE